ncbi:Oxygen-sensitive ribonucleoside-triphosphate reductase [Agathobacter rectalis M104/1]|mgnify:FL=1|jgi:anaerobic ribonucleoside-triphosphate reductase|uniref:anaerobic ribonucleoside-triphosphate reductase n=1 Tax=Agathobacter rectalis TaxID=39491 RepID=UPI0001CD1587|nr:anaerobic ribonucleoside-triphosphate reductase [Agathobacter rectalis]CBK95296.1 Oxygen-sensitive ribonucleoside-triphosphate reductase [Agathobacter rectalis M104/1]
MKIIKRSGMEVDFDVTKIAAAVRKANNSVVDYEKISEDEIIKLSETIENACSNMQHTPTVEDIQDMVENQLMSMKKFTLARNYITYRYRRELVRKSNTTDDQILSLIECNNEEVKQENSNKNPTVNSVQRDYMAGEVSKDITKRFLLPADIWDAHEKGLIHFHDADYFAQHMHNCCLVNLEDMLQNGTVISGTMIDTPKSFSTTCNIATQVVAQIASAQYGGQTIALSHLIPFVDVSRKKIYNRMVANFNKMGLAVSDSKLRSLVEAELDEEISRGVQTIQYQLITLMTTNGQAPFVSIFMNIGDCKSEQEKADFVKVSAEIFNQRIKGVKNEKGIYVTPAFPKLLYVLDECNIHEDSPYFWLTQLAAKCTAKRMVPDYISAKQMRELKNGNVYGCMGCRSFLTVDRYSETVGNISKAKNFDEHKGHVYFGRFNQGVVTLNLVDVACSSGRDMDKFWEILDERLELCHRALRCRHERLLGTKSDVAPILWQHGGLARLGKGEVIDPLLFNGYSTISLGYAGLCEMCRYMLGKSHTDPSATPFALKVMQKLNEACNKWKAAENIDYSIYGTPLESTTYKFAKCLQKRFGIIKGVTDKNYITNSYHVHVTEQINAFDKLKFESQFQKLSPGGAISYVEVPDMQTNIPAVVAVIQYIYDNIMYAELNTKSDYCEVCGYDGEIKVVEDEKSHKLVWECPHCGNRDQNKMSVARRTCGYIGTQFWNQGRTQEIKERVLHL